MHQILFYCQYYSSLGPAIRTVRVCQELIQEFRVDCLLGKPVDLQYDIVAIPSPHFNRILLPSFGRVKERIQSPPTRTEMIERKKVMDKLLPGCHYDLFITEMFPFSKTYLLPEIQYIYQEIRKVNPHCRLLCLMRDIADRTSLDLAPLIQDFVQKYCDKVIVLADPHIIRLEESFPGAKAFHEKIFYAGYLPNRSLKNRGLKREKKILVSLGTGGLAEELAYAVSNVADYFPDYHFTFCKGFQASDALEQHLKKRDSVPFIEDFEEALCSCCLSISLGGSSLIDVVDTKTPSLAYPAEMSDQPLRIQAFAAKKLVQPLNRADLQKENLQKIIAQALVDRSAAHFTINMQGAIETKKWCSSFLTQGKFF